MDIHRSRFVPFPAAPINAVAFSRTSDQGFSDFKPALRLAIGRTNGSVEIWNADNGDWWQETVFPGGQDRSIEGLVWTQEPDDVDGAGKSLVGQLRLFSIGSTASVTEWNLGTGRSLRQSTGNFSEIWCIAAQPRHAVTKEGGAAKEGEWTGQDLVIGCGDGSLALVSTADDDLTFKRFLARSGSKKTRCMSVIWQGRERVVAGFSDSNIRVYDSRNGTLVRNMSLGASIPGAPKDTLVWKVKTLPNGDIVSADSNGELRIWDGRTYSMSQRISGHESDCLDIITSTDGQTIFSGGIDGRVAVYRLNTRDGNRRVWAKSQHRKMHQGEIKAMAVYDSKRMSVVVTGGADTTPNVSPLRDYGREHSRRLPGLPQRQPCVSAPRARLLVSWWECSIWIWHIGEQDSGFAPDARSKKLLSKLALEGEDDITSVDISKDGRVLVASTAVSTKAFQLKLTTSPEPRLRIRRVELPPAVAKQGSRLVGVSLDGHWLVAISLENDVQIMRAVPSEADPKRLSVLPDVAELDRSQHPPIRQSGLKLYEQSIRTLAFSTDSRTLAVSDLSGHLDIFTLDGDVDPAGPAAVRVQPVKNASRKLVAGSDSDFDSSDDDDDLPLSFYGQTWSLSQSSHKLPKLDSAASVISFCPSSGYQALLFVITQHHQVYEFDTQKGRLSDWSRRNPVGVLPADLRMIKDRVMGVIWDSRESGDQHLADKSRTDRAWLYSSSWLAMLDIRQEFGQTKQLGDSNAEANSVVPHGKRKRAAEEERWEAARAEHRRQKGRSGAGSKAPESQLRGFASTKPATDETLTVLESADVEMPDASDGNEEEHDDEAFLPLARPDDSSAEEESADQDGAGEEEQSRRWWCTYKYRPILGIVPLESSPPVNKLLPKATSTSEGNREAARDANEDGGHEPNDEALPVEVVLVERPVWDLEHFQP